MNTVTLRGYVTQDSQVQNIGSKNTQCLNFRIGVTNSFKNERGNIEKKSMFFDISVYGSYAGAIGSLQKGTLIFVQGKLNQDSWEKDGEKHSKVSIIASKVYPIRKQDLPPQQQAQTPNTQASNTQDNLQKLNMEEIQQIVQKQEEIIEIYDDEFDYLAEEIQ